MGLCRYICRLWLGDAAGEYCPPGEDTEEHEYCDPPYCDASELFLDSPVLGVCEYGDEYPEKCLAWRGEAVGEYMRPARERSGEFW